MARQSISLKVKLQAVTTRGYVHVYDLIHAMKFYIIYSVPPM